LLPLPPYSPEYNPIEKTWAHIKKQSRCKSQTCTKDTLLYVHLLSP
ncbi:transposase, partial [Streptococcus pneumoniae]